MNVLQPPGRRVPDGRVILAAAGGLLLLLILVENNFFVSTNLEPHGYRYRWDPGLVGVHFTTDLLIGLSYMAISATLLYLVYKARRALPFHWLFIAFGTFIIAGGATHLIALVTLWTPLYWLSGGAKVVTAVASVATALVLPPRVPIALRWLENARQATAAKRQLGEQAAELAERNAALQAEIAERRRVEDALRASEEQFRSAFDYAAIGMALVGLDGRWLQVNAALCEITGYTATELQARTFADLTHPEDLAPDQEYVQQLLDGEIRHYQIEKRYRHRAGHFVWIQLIRSLLRDAQGRPLHFISQYQDITSRKQADEALRQAEARERFAKVFQASPHAIALSRAADGIILDVNPSWVHLMGYQAEEVLGQAGAGLGLWHDQAARAQILTLLHQEHTVRDFEAVFRDKEGAVWEGSVTLETINILGEDCLLTIIQDITARKQMEERARAAERLGALGRVAAGVAHEFNNALAAIMGRLDLLALEIGDPARTPSLPVIQQAVEDAAAVVKRVQTFTRLRQPGPPATVPVADLINDVLALTQPHWRTPPTLTGTGITIRTALAPGLAVRGNPTELREVLTNLLLNAVDAQAQAGEIVITADAQDEWVRIRVQDHGVGMDSATQQRIFEPFFTTKLSGSGLGLAVVKDIVESHGGAIRVASQPGAGSTFTLTLPHGGAPASPPVAAVPGPAPGAARILVVDDDPLQAKLLRAILATGGHTVVVASSGAEALALLDQQAFDLVCTDLGMPGMNGWEVARQVRRRAPGTPVGLVTGWGDQLDPAQVAATVDFVLAKPYRLAQVQELLAQMLGRSRRDEE